MLLLRVENADSNRMNAILLQLRDIGGVDPFTFSKHAGDMRLRISP
jgi:hypothetical protein